jgi:hypothetical protein
MSKILGSTYHLSNKLSNHVELLILIARSFEEYNNLLRNKSMLRKEGVFSAVHVVARGRYIREIRLCEIDSGNINSGKRIPHYI